MNAASQAPEKSRNHLIAVPALLALGAAAVLVSLLLFWSVTRADSVAFHRQSQLVANVLENSAAKTAREQEGMTFRDAAAEWLKTTEKTDEEMGQMDRNFGTFFYRYYGHDESYVLTGDDRPFYAMRGGKRVEPRSFERIRSVVTPVIRELRAKTRALPRGVPLLNKGSPGAYDLMVVNGHPAIVSAKAVISTSGREIQPLGSESLQISILYLDGRFIADLRRNYLFQGARFSWRDDARGGEASRPFRSRHSGTPIGYFIWRPYAPGAVIFNDMAVPLVVALALMTALVLYLIRRAQRSAKRLAASEAQAKHLAFHDVLTGLPNRALFEDRLDRALARIRREPGEKLALLFVDLDRFKQVNDTLGHAAGDELIRQLGAELNHAVRATDTVARLGGDEFAVIQTGIHARADVEQLCERLLKIVEKPFMLVGSQAFVGMSIGVALAGEHALDRAELSRKADIALYHVKGHGRGDYAVFAEAMDATLQTRQSLERDLRVALDAGQLEVYYQPKYDVATKAISGIEALLRWHHPERGLVCPSVFIPIAEESGLIDRVGDWVAQEVANRTRDWPVKTVSINVSAVQLRSDLYAARLLKMLQAAGMDPARLELEITETAFLENIAQCHVNLQALRDAGVRIALDDFGTGYSSFSNLQHHHVDRLKIDRSFVNAIKDSEGGAIIRAIIGVARSMGLEITAEGVETNEQRTFLTEAGCDELQGFLLSEPMTARAIERLIGVPRRTKAKASLAA